MNIYEVTVKMPQVYFMDRDDYYDRYVSYPVTASSANNAVEAVKAMHKNDNYKITAKLILKGA